MKSFKKFFLVAISFGIPWAILMILVRWVLDELTLTMVLTYLVAGLLGGVLFSAIMSKLKSYFYKKVVFIPESGETILFETGANRILNKEGVGGKLFLTSTGRLIFKSHQINIQVHELNLPINAIIKVEGGKSLGIFPNKLKVYTPDNNYTFIVDELVEWQVRLTPNRL